MTTAKLCDPLILLQDCHLHMHLHQHCEKHLPDAFTNRTGASLFEVIEHHVHMGSGGGGIGAPFARDLLIVLKAAEALQDTMPRLKMRPSSLYVYLPQHSCPELRLAG